MATTWVLHTGTKGTGAQMVPLEKAKKRPASAEPMFVRRTAAPAPDAPEQTARQPRRFRIVDVMTRQVLVDGASTRETLEALREVRSIVDVTMYVWDEDRGRWRLLTLAEQDTLLDYARQTKN